MLCKYNAVIGIHDEEGQDAALGNCHEDTHNNLGESSCMLDLPVGLRKKLACSPLGIVLNQVLWIKAELT